VTTPQRTLEHIERCPLCGSIPGKPMMRVRDRNCGLPGQFALVCCSGCGLVMLSPRPARSELRDYYPKEYYAYQAPAPTAPRHRSGLAGRMRDAVRNQVLRDLGYSTPPASGLARLLVPALVPLFRTRGTYGLGIRFPRAVEGGRALDVGCGNGAYLSYLKRHGWHVEGVDLSEAAARSADGAFGIPVRVGAFDELAFARAEYDWVHMSHVIEHLPDPVASLARVFDLLKPGGALYIETPNAESFSLPFCGEFWFPWEAPRHLFVFTPSTLVAALERRGFVVRVMRSRAFQGLYAWEDTYRREHTLGVRLQSRPALSPSAHPRAWLLTGAAGLMRLVRPLSGDILECVAHKPGAAA